MDKPHCDTCPYWDLADPRMDWTEEDESKPAEQVIREAIAEGTVDGECRRYPRFTPGNKGNETTAIWPRTANYDWCGEHPDFPAYLESLRHGATHGPADMP